MPQEICVFWESLWCADADSEMITTEEIMTCGDSDLIYQVINSLVENAVNLYKVFIRRRKRIGFII